MPDAELLPEAEEEVDPHNRIVPLEPLPPVLDSGFGSESADVAVEALIRDWAVAWSEQRIEDYLSFYGGSFRPPRNMSRPRWESWREERLSAPAFIRVTLDSVEVRIEGVNRALVEFRQAYTSEAYNDVVTKRLELSRERGRWKITAETVVQRGR